MVGFFPPSHFSYRKESLMAEKGNPVEKKVLLAPDTMFTNSKAMVIEFHDVLCCHWFSLFYTVACNQVLSEVFQLDMFQGMDAGELFEWYIHRKHRNFFYDLELKRCFQTQKDMDAAFSHLLQEMGGIPELYQFPTQMSMGYTMRQLILSTPHLVQHIYVYEGERKESELENWVQETYAGKASITFLSGPFEKAIEGVNRDATYILSDIDKISILEQQKRIECASILLAAGYRYNALPNDPDTLKIDIEALLQKYTCRVMMFDNFNRCDILTPPSPI